MRRNTNVQMPMKPPHTMLSHGHMKKSVTNIFTSIHRCDDHRIPQGVQRSEPAASKAMAKGETSIHIAHGNLINEWTSHGMFMCISAKNAGNHEKIFLSRAQMSRRTS